jgi:hypothetical protein
MKTLDRVPATELDLEVEALIKEARQRQRRRRRAIALVLVAIAVTALGAWASSRTMSVRGSRRAAEGPPSAGSVLRGAGTALLMWPAGAPNFGDLPGGGSGTTADLDNLTTGHVSPRRIPGIAGGDFSNALLPVGRWLVYNSAGDVSVIADDLQGSPRVLGNASWFVPSAVTGSVLLVYVDSAVIPRSVRFASVATGSLGPVITLPKRTQQVIESTDRGLLLQFPHQLDLWRPGGRPTKLGYLTHLDSLAIAANARLVASGTSCKSEEATTGFPSGPVGYSACATLRIIDLVSGRRRSFPAPRGTLGWVPGESQSGFEATIAPAGTMLAAQAAITPAQAGRTQLFVVHLARDHNLPTAVPLSTVREGADAAWSIDGSWLLYQGPSTRLRAFQPTTGHSQTLGQRCCEFAAMAAVHSHP